MNFKRFHESKNLFDKDNTTIYSAYFDQGGSWILSADSKSVKMPCQPNTQYTLSVPNSLAVFRVYESNNASIEPKYPSTADIPRATEIIRGTNISQYTFTTSSTAQIILFQGSNSSVTEWFNGLMLNTGSTAKPFEPYGNTWTDIPHYIMGTSTDTLTTLPADVYADGQSAIVGLVGNMVQNGSPSPSSIIIPQECGEMTRNLYFKAIQSCSIDSSGRLTGNSQFMCYVAKVKANQTYVGEKGYVYAFFDSEPSAGSQAYDNQRITENARVPFTAPIDGYVTVRFNTGTTDAMLNTGETALPFEPYGYKIPILNNSQTTNVYLGEVQSTRQIKQLIFDGTEDWKYDGTNFYLNISSMSEPVVSNSPLICSHFVNSSQGMRNGSNWAFVTLYQSATSANAWKTYLQQQYAAGTPVCVWYVLATPETAVVNEPLRKIGNYADTVSGITIPTIAGANTIDVDTTLKPSEVSVNYHGWHPVQSVHERESGAWD